MSNAANDAIVIVWSTADRDIARELVLPYALNSKKQGWWEDVTLIVWGSASNVLANDATLKPWMADLAEQGVRLEACKACADQYKVTGDLERLGIDVKYMGKPLTDYIKEDRKVLTF
ncbi:MAG: DsrE family protein [Spirochaetales bacterium]|nr:DsrE family protein [Spirochaetales bacterium]MCF7939812.1 DsrE family protein [Spirochaetales bacterium]